MVRPTLPVTWRRPGTLQIGLDPDRSVILTDAPPGADHAVRLLLAGRTVDELVALPRGVDPDWIRRISHRLADLDLLPRRRGPSTREAVILGSGALADACRAALTDVGIRVTHDRSTGALPVTSRGQVRLVATDRVEPDRGTLAELTRLQIPHLVVRAEPEQTVVGPFIAPGRTPCQRCLDLTRRDLDSRWPHLLAQLCRMVSAPDPGHARWAGATALAQLRSWWSGTQPETVGVTLEMGCPSHRQSFRRWSFHPECLCRQGTPAAA